MPWIQCVGGPHNGNTYIYPEPLPAITVIATAQPLMFHQYERSGDTTTYSYIGIIWEGN